MSHGKSVWGEKKHRAKCEHIYHVFYISFDLNMIFILMGYDGDEFYVLLNTIKAD